MKNVIITGANGMIGGLILKNCLNRLDISKVTIVVRKSLGINHPKLEEIIHSDFMNYSDLKNKLSNQDICFFCIGVYTGQVPNLNSKR
jgi:putative NADH-flavin reductase